MCPPARRGGSRSSTSTGAGIAPAKRGRSGRQLGAALRAPGPEDGPARAGLHACAEAVLALSAPVVRLKGSLGHVTSSPLTHGLTRTPVPLVAKSRGLSLVPAQYRRRAFVHVKTPIHMSLRALFTSTLTTSRARCLGWQRSFGPAIGIGETVVLPPWCTGLTRAPQWQLRCPQLWINLLTTGGSEDGSVDRRGNDPAPGPAAAGRRASIPVDK